MIAHFFVLLVADSCGEIYKCIFDEWLDTRSGFSCKVIYIYLKCALMLCKSLILSAACSLFSQGLAGIQPIDIPGVENVNIVLHHHHHHHHHASFFSALIFIFRSTRPTTLTGTHLIFGLRGAFWSNWNLMLTFPFSPTFPSTTPMSRESRLRVIRLRELRWRLVNKKIPQRTLHKLLL